MKVRYAKNLITGCVEMQSSGTEGNQADLDLMRSNMIGDGANGLTPSDVEVGWEEAETVEGWITDFNKSLMTYSDRRILEYPSIGECVHAILDDDLENLQILRQAVKEKYPK